MSSAHPGTVDPPLMCSGAYFSSKVSFSTHSLGHRAWVGREDKNQWKRNNGKYVRSSVVCDCFVSVHQIFMCTTHNIYLWLFVMLAYGFEHTHTPLICEKWPYKRKCKHILELIAAHSELRLTCTSSYSPDEAHNNWERKYIFIKIIQFIDLCVTACICVGRVGTSHNNRNG